MRLKVNGSLSGSDPVKPIETWVSSAVVVDTAFAVGGRFVCVTFQANVALAVNAPSLAVMVTAFDGEAPNATVPPITPEFAAIARPAGNPLAVKFSASLSGSVAATANVTGAFSALVRVPRFVIAGARFV